MTASVASMESGKAVAFGGKRGLNRRFSGLIDALKRPDRWALLSCCDWYPDPALYPSNHAALLMLDANPSSDSRED